MDQHNARAPRALVGVAAMALGTVAIVAGLAAPASAHRSKVEPKPEEDNLSCPELADLFEVDQEWTEFKIDDVASGTFAIDADDSVTITVDRGKVFSFESTLGIDAVYVQGEDTSLPENSYFYLYAREADDTEVTEDEDLGTPPYRKFDKNKIKSISFCFDEDDHGGTTSSTTTSSSTSTSSSSTSTTSSSSTTSTTMAPSSTTSTSVAAAGPTSTRPTPPATTSRERLPETGSNTGPLVMLGVVLVIVGAVLVVTTRRFWHRPA